MGDKMVGINLETSEVFETSDLTEADQHYFPVEETDSIETIDVTTSQAFGRFKGAFVDNKSVDFSDTIRNTRRKGYIVWKGEEENTKEENPAKKYQRLNCEIRELIDEIREARSGGETGIEAATLESLSSQVDVLHKHLLELRLEDILGKETLEIMTDPQAAARERLISQLMEIQQMKASDRSTDATNTQGSKLNYTLLLKPDSCRLQTQAGVNRLNARISSLEKVIGENDEDLSILAMETGRKTLSEAVSVLSARTTVLEPKNLDHIEGRLAVLQQRLAEVDQVASSDTEEKESLEKLRNLASVNQKSEQWAAEIPDVIDRMEALNPLHIQGVELSQNLLELETVQKQLLLQISNNTSLLREIEKRFAQNLASIEKNFDTLNTRIEAVKRTTK